MSDNVEPAPEEAAIIGSRTLQRDTKEILDRVQDGESIVILRHGRPAAALIPIDEEQARAIVLAGSPPLRASRAPTAVAEQAPANPSAVAEREIEAAGDNVEPEPTRSAAAGLDPLEETNRLLALAAARLEEHQRVAAASAGGGEGGEFALDASLLAIQRRSMSAALGDILEGFREQAEALEARGNPRRDTGAQAAGGAGAGATPA